MSITSIRETIANRYTLGDRDFRDLGDRLQGVDLSNLTLEKCNFSGANLTAANMANINLKSSDLAGAILHSANMDKAVLTGATLRNTQFQQASLIDCDLKFSFLSKSNFAGANLKGSQLEPSVLIDAQYDENTVFPEGFELTGKGIVKASEIPQKEDFRQLTIQKPEFPNSSQLSSSNTVNKSAPSDFKTSLTNPPTTATSQLTAKQPFPKKKKMVMYRGRIVEM